MSVSAHLHDAEMAIAAIEALCAASQMETRDLNALYEFSARVSALAAAAKRESQTHATEADRARFEKYVMPEPNSGCWLWMGACSSKGYASFLLNGRNRPGHRVSYLLHRGAIGEGLELDHTCRVRCCVNPQHLEAVTHKTNCNRAPHSNAIKTHCKAGHPFSEENTAISLKFGRPARVCRSCRRDYEKSRRRKVGGSVPAEPAREFAVGK